MVPPAGLNDDGGGWQAANRSMGGTRCQPHLRRDEALAPAIVAHIGAEDHAHAGLRQLHDCPTKLRGSAAAALLTVEVSQERLRPLHEGTDRALRAQVVDESQPNRISQSGKLRAKAQSAEDHDFTWIYGYSIIEQDTNSCVT